MVEWLIRNGDDPSLYWSTDRVPPWVSVSEATLFSTDAMRMVGGACPGEWVEAWECDRCGELMPEDTGTSKVNEIWVAGAGRVACDHEWFCANCVALAEEQEVRRAEDRIRQYYELK
jgi:hypothetical protein